MAFTFLGSYQPDTEHPDDEEEDEMPMARSGRVRAFSHLPDRAAGKEPDAPPPQVGVGRSGGMRPARPMPANEEADEVTDAPPMLRSGSVRAFSHLPDSTKGEDDEGAHQPPAPPLPRRHAARASPPVPALLSTLRSRTMPLIQPPAAPLIRRWMGETPRHAVPPRVPPCPASPQAAQA